MAELTAQAMTRAGLKATYSTPIITGDYFYNYGNQFSHIKNDSASSITIVIYIPGKVDGMPVTNRTFTIPAGEEKFSGPFPPAYYNESVGIVRIGYSAVTDVTIAVLTHGAL